MGKKIKNVQFKFVQNIRTNRTFFRIGFIRFYIYPFCIRFEQIIFNQYRSFVYIIIGSFIFKIYF